MTGPAYPAARHAATKIESHFTQHGPGLVDIETMEAMIDVAFWASLRREEGYSPRISIAYLSPEDAGRPLLLDRPLPLDPLVLTRVAAGADRPGLHLGVWRAGEGLHIWGTTRTIPTFTFVVQVIAPGLLVIKHRRNEETGKFVNIAVLEGEQIKILDPSAAMLPDCPALLTSLLGVDAPPNDVHAINILIELAVSMQAHGRGGSLLLVPRDSSEWKNSIIPPIPYEVSPRYSELADLMESVPPEPDRNWRDAMRKAVATISGLTAVDGATVLDDRYNLLAFGAKIGRPEGRGRVAEVTVSEPIERSRKLIVHPEQLGGTRHQSAVQFANDQRDAVALVASQDGRFTVFAYSPCDGMVHAHRVETLLL